MENLPRQLKYEENTWDDETSVEETMKDVKKRIKSIAFAVKEDFENDRFGMVLGVDASGRVPALLLARLMQYKNKVEIRFVAGNKNVDNEDSTDRQRQLQEHFSSEEFKGNIGKREVLIVDDIIASGDSLVLICNALKAVDIPYKVASLALEDSKNSSSKEEIEKKLKTEIFVGSEGSLYSGEYPSIYGKQQMAGVKKGVGMFAQSIEKTAEDLKKLGFSNQKTQNYEVLNRTRELIDQTAKELAVEIGWE